MAKYDVTFSCGHTGTVELFGKSADRERRITYFEKYGECPACYKARKAQELADMQNLYSSLPALTGANHQLLEAVKIRNQFYEKCLKSVENPVLTDEQKEVTKRAMDYFFAESRASWWLTNEFSLLSLMQKLIKEVMEHPEAYPDRSAAQEQKAKERETQIADEATATVTPENLKHPGVVKIVTSENTIRVSYGKDDAFREMIRSLHYRWDSDARAWSRKIGLRAGSVADRVAELGNTLLNAGFAVCILDADLRERAIRAEYTPECRRWITYIAECGKLAISWDREDDLYDRARKLHGAKWSSGQMLVPLSSWDEVLDFGEALGFSVSDIAQREIEVYRSRLSAPVTPIALEHKPERDALKEILQQSPEVLDDLRDE